MRTEIKVRPDCNSPYLFWDLLTIYQGLRNLEAEFPDTICFLRLLESLEKLSSSHECQQPGEGDQAGHFNLQISELDPVSVDRLIQHYEINHRQIDRAQLMAAAKLFSWSNEIYVTRAPGRLDVMGGIADYSGATVLQLPIAAAAHVALQLQPMASQNTDGQPLSSSRQEEEMKSLHPTLRIISFTADTSDRDAVVNVDISRLMDSNNEPISYDKVK